VAQSITLLGATYADVPAVELPKTGGGSAQFDDTTDATATAADILTGKTAYVNGIKLTGTGSGGGGGPYAWLGSNAELVGTKLNRAINLSSDTTYDSWTASTTATTIVPASSTADASFDCDFTEYDYAIASLGTVEPIYVAGTPATYRTYRVCQYYITYAYGYISSSSTANVQSGVPTTQTSVSSSSSFAVQFYYNNAGNIVARSGTQCGPIYMNTWPTVTFGTWVDGICPATVKLPAFYARCDNSRFSTTRKGQVDSANTNYTVKIDLYRVPRGNGLFSYWCDQMVNYLNA